MKLSLAFVVLPATDACTWNMGDFTIPGVQWKSWTCNCNGGAGTIDATGVRSRDADNWFQQGGRCPHQTIGDSGAECSWSSHSSSNTFHLTEGSNIASPWVAYAMTNNNWVETAEMHIDVLTITCANGYTNGVANGTMTTHFLNRTVAINNVSTPSAMGWTAVSGNGWCVDKSGNEGVNRAFGKGNDCMNRCQADRTCPGFASGGQNQECVWYTDVSPTTTGRPASSFAIDHAAWSASQPSWSTAKCFKYTSRTAAINDVSTPSVGNVTATAACAGIWQPCTTDADCCSDAGHCVDTHSTHVCNGMFKDKVEEVAVKEEVALAVADECSSVPRPETNSDAYLCDKAIYNGKYCWTHCGGNCPAGWGVLASTCYSEYGCFPFAYEYLCKKLSAEDLALNATRFAALEAPKAVAEEVAVKEAVALEVADECSSVPRPETNSDAYLCDKAIYNGKYCWTHCGGNCPAGWGVLASTCYSEYGCFTFTYEYLCKKLSFEELAAEDNATLVGAIQV